MPDILEPGWSEHSGPDWIRVLAPKGASKKITNNSSSCLERNATIREARTLGISIKDLCAEYGLQYGTVCKIISGN